ncbi:MAG: hypothetical protein PUE58_01810 [Lachnospiraceae bacterium]|nr:hypothetical protein [Lachnospiraceae bacterium]
MTRDCNPSYLQSFYDHRDSDNQTEINSRISEAAKIQYETGKTYGQQMAEAEISKQSSQMATERMERRMRKADQILTDAESLIKNLEEKGYCLAEVNERSYFFVLGEETAQKLTKQDTQFVLGKVQKMVREEFDS